VSKNRMDYILTALPSQEIFLKYFISSPASTEVAL
jgi:hypothetical protein